MQTRPWFSSRVKRTRSCSPSAPILIAPYLLSPNLQKTAPLSLPPNNWLQTRKVCGLNVNSDAKVCLWDFLLFISSISGNRHLFILECQSRSELFFHPSVYFTIILKLCLFVCLFGFFFWGGAVPVLTLFSVKRKGKV